MARLAREGKGNHRFGALGFLMAIKTIPPDLEPTLRGMLTSDDVWRRIWARQALIRLGMPDRERDAMIEAMLTSPEDAERIEGDRVLIQLDKPERAIPVLREIEFHRPQGIRAQAVRLLDKATQTGSETP
jgi:hypothetical protein